MGNPIVWIYVRRVARLAAAATLLWFDPRLFALYFFLIVLRTWEAVDYVRASLRVIAVENEFRSYALMRKTDVTLEDVTDVVREVREQQYEGDLKKLARDWTISTGRRQRAEELFSTKPYRGFSVLRRESETADEFMARVHHARYDDLGADA